MFPTVNLEGCIASQWNTVQSFVGSAIVFADQPMIECLHWRGGLMRLLNAGALNVKELSSFESGADDEKKAVFLTSSLLFDKTATVIRDIIKSSHFQYCIVITTVSHGVHLSTKNTPNTQTKDELFLFHQFEDCLIEWMNVKNGVAEVVHVPLLLTSITDGLFITPAFSRLFPLLSSDKDRINDIRMSRGEKYPIDNLNDIELSHLPGDLQTSIRTFVSSLSRLFDMWNIQEDCYSVGAFSRLITAELVSLQAFRSKKRAPPQKASLVVIDRTLDMAGVCSHDSNLLVDQLWAVLPRLNDNDVRIDMTRFSKMHSSLAKSMVPSGCLAECSEHLKNLFSMRKKECLNDINRNIMDAITKEKIPAPQKKTPVNVEQLDTLVDMIKLKQGAVYRHAATVQTAQAIIQTLTHPDLEKFSECLSIEKGLIQSIVDFDGPSAASQITKLITQTMDQSKQSSLDMDDIMLLLVYAYSIAGAQCSRGSIEEKGLINALTGGVMRSLGSLPSFWGQYAAKMNLLSLCVVGADADQQKIKTKTQNIVNKLKDLSVCREQLKKLRSVHSSVGALEMATYNPLLRQIIDEIFHPNKPDLVDIEQRSSGFRDMLKTGFSYFVSVNKPRPSDSQLMIFFVVGGVTAQEVKLIKDSVAMYDSSKEVIVCATRLLNGNDALNELFLNDNLFIEII